MKRGISVCILLASCGCAGLGGVDLPHCADDVFASWEIPSEWYSSKLTFEQAQHIVHTGDIPIDEIRGRWQVLVSELQPEDQLWFFVRPHQSWVHEVAGEQGVVLNRGCRQVGHVTTSVSIEENR